MSVKDRKRDLYIRFRGRIVIKISFGVSFYLKEGILLCISLMIYALI
mgnify:CR=1 FL=1